MGPTSVHQRLPVQRQDQTFHGLPITRAQPPGFTSDISQRRGGLQLRPKCNERLVEYFQRVHVQPSKLQLCTSG